MSDIIKLLPDSVANQIAAGEVIQRPASVIKELVENSVDAGATEINIVIRDAGKTLIQVSDNGKGMSDTDARMAFERHATSKIRKVDDLFSLQSMGFRGEALPSICAISEVELKTRTSDSQLGTRLVIEGSRVKCQETYVAPQGCVISVKRLFFNVPARRKFLKSDSVELSNIMREFERLALVNHRIRMSIDTGSRIISLRPGTLKQRIEELWKNTLNSEQLLPVEVTTSLIKIEGYISRPEFARRRNPLQYLIVNGRNMRHPYFHKAIVSCYESLIAPGTQPNYFLVFTVNPETIDVNIHPTKNEIKFENEQEIWPILSSAIKTSLGKFSAVPSIDFDSQSIQVNPLVSGNLPKQPDMNFNPGYNPFEQSKQHTPVNPAWRPTKVETNWQALYSSDSTTNSGVEHGGGLSEGITDPGMPSIDGTLAGLEPECDIAPICMQFGQKYIITTNRNGLLIIDQHRAHLKVLYEEYLELGSGADTVTQTLMFPEQVSLDSPQQAALSEVEGDLKKFGFTLEYESDTEWNILTMPAMMKQGDVRDTVLRILDSVIEDSSNYGNDARAHFSIRERVALLMARSCAIRRGVKLTSREMEDLITRLFMLPDPSLTPNGNTIFTILKDSDLAKLLG